MEIKWLDEEEPFFRLLSVTTLEQWMGFGQMGHSEVTFPYLNIISANFQQNPYSHFAVYLSIRLLLLLLLLL